MPHTPALPFRLRRSKDVYGAAFMTTTTETVHGLLRLEADRLVVQWRLGRKTDHIGAELRTDEEFESVREVAIPLDAVSGAAVRKRWWELWKSPRIVLTAADLQAFEEITGEGGLRLAHPAELVLGLRRSDRLIAEEFSAELELALAKRGLEAAEGHRRLADPAGPGARGGPTETGTLPSGE